MGVQAQQVSEENGLDRLLDAAEDEFSERGYDGAGMKGIAARSGTSHSLLHYHFGTKEKLYEAVIARRSAMINQARHALLDEVDLTAPDAVDRIFAALFTPPLGPEGRGKSYARIFAGLAVGGDRDSKLVQRHYDKTARRFVKALAGAMPNATQKDAARAYTMALGALVVALSGDERTNRIAGVDDEPAEPAALIPDLAAYARGGFEALIAKKSEGKKSEEGGTR